MKRISLTSDLTEWRTAAVRKVDNYFNGLARFTMHADLVALATGNSAPVLEREARRQEMLALIAAAQSPAQIDEITATLS